MQDGQLKRFLGFVFPHARLNRPLRILIVTNAALSFLVSLFAPFYAVFIASLGGGVALAGFSWALYSIIAGVLILLFANWELKVKQQELLIALGYLIRGGVFLSYAFMGTLTQLFITQVLWGIATAISTPAFDAVYASHTNAEDSIVQWGGWEGISAIMVGAGALIGGIVIQGFGYQTVFLAMAAISVGLGVYIWMQPRDVL